MDVYDLLEYIDNNIGGYTVTDDDFRQWAKELARVVLESEDMERNKGMVVYHLFKRYYNAVKRCGFGYRSIHNQILKARYFNLFDFFCEETEALTASIPNYGDEVSAMLIQCGTREELQASHEPRLKTERERLYFDKAIKAGFMEETETGYRWVYLQGGRGSKASLAYFLLRIYDPNNKDGIIPFKELNRLFGITRLDRAIDQLTYTKNKQKWRDTIDNLFND